MLRQLRWENSSRVIAFSLALLGSCATISPSSSALAQDLNLPLRGLNKGPLDEVVPVDDLSGSDVDRAFK
jgi:hypothetical protein